jgi:hypothetical protein
MKAAHVSSLVNTGAEVALRTSCIGACVNGSIRNPLNHRFRQSFLSYKQPVNSCAEGQGWNMLPGIGVFVIATTGGTARMPRNTDGHDKRNFAACVARGIACV